LSLTPGWHAVLAAQRHHVRVAGGRGNRGAARELGKTIVSSADLVSRFEAVLTSDQIASHYEARERIDEILAAAWKHMAARLRPPGQTAVKVGSGSPLDEYEMMQWLKEAMRRAGIAEGYGPNVSVNANSSDSHYEPTPSVAMPITEGDSC